jgi:hypothetical protein
MGAAFSFAHQRLKRRGWLWGEPVGLLPVDERWYTIYFAQFPIARFDSRKLRVLPLPQEEDYDIADAGEGEASPSTPSPHRRGGKTVRDVPGLKCQVCSRPFRRQADPLWEYREE